MLEAGVYHEQYGKLYTAQYSSIQVHITLFGKWCIAPVPSYTWFILPITPSHGRNISVVWNTCFHPPIFLKSPLPFVLYSLQRFQTHHTVSVWLKTIRLYIMDFLPRITIWRSRGSSVSVVTRSRTERFEKCIPVQERHFYLLQNMQTSSVPRPAFYSMGTGFFPRVKRFTLLHYE